MSKSLVLLLTLVSLLILLGSCKSSDPDTIAQNEIRDILYDISTDFNMQNIEGIMDHLHEEYLHKSMISWGFNDLWNDRMTQFNLLEIEVLYIELMDNKAIVHSTNTFISPTHEEILSEPEESGDISYFIRDDGMWLLYGNQEWSREEAQRLAEKHQSRG